MPVSAVLGTAIPVAVTAFTEGLPREVQVRGFGLALAGIWRFVNRNGARRRFDIGGEAAWKAGGPFLAQSCRRHGWVE